MTHKKIAIIGLGLIGGSMAKKLSEKGLYIIGIDTDQAVLESAKNEGVISFGCKNPEQAVGQADIIILSVYPKAAEEFVEKYHKSFKKGAILTDVAGVKTPLAEMCKKVCPDVVYVGGHPMAGREVNGFDNSNKDLFIGANFIVTPSEQAGEADICLIEELAEHLGCRNIVRTTPEEHDGIIAYTSQLPHIIAVAMCETPLLVKHKKYTGGSFEDVTRVAKINEVLWSELFLLNKSRLLDVIGTFEDSISRIKQAVQDDDTERLKELFVKVRTDKELIDNENN